MTKTTNTSLRSDNCGWFGCDLPLHHGCIHTEAAYTSAAAAARYLTNSTTHAARLSAKAAARAAIDFGTDVLDAMCEVGLLPIDEATTDELRALPRADGFTRTATGLLAWVDDLDDEQLYLTITDPRGWVEAHVRFPRTPLGLKLITAATTAALAEVAA